MKLRILKRLLGAVFGLAVWGIIAVYFALEGAWMSSSVATGDTDSFYAWAVNEIDSKNKGNSALVLIEDGQVAKRYFSNVQESVDGDTLFPTASFSKWVTALGVMSLVEDDLLDLDAPASHYLTRWQLPESEFDNDAVTIRRLLSHTAGLTDRLGFGDYQFDEVIPELEDELRQPRTSHGESVEVAVGIEPGTEFLYSGGGYSIMQLVVEEVSGVSFEAYIQNVLFDPLDMDRSTYASVAKLENVSSSYHLDGSVAQSFQYASAAATGLASSSNDLTNLVKTILSAANDPLLKPATIAAMREPHGFVMGAGIWGLGTMLYAPSGSGESVFGHDGANDPAINTTVRLNPDTSSGIVVLISGHPSLATNIGSEWVLWQTGYADFLQTERALKSAVLPFLIGGLLLLFAVFVSSRLRG
ncbi:MAG: CubicO group peptidase (beta-lactamase class C family) [Candidatus Azotimanducaceae bacterium]